MKQIIIILCAVLSLFFARHYALGLDDPKGATRQPGPPPGAFTACEGKVSGDSATFEGRNGELLTGTCEVMQGVLIMVPENRPAKEGEQNNNDASNTTRRPPPEAVSACEGKKTDERTQFIGRDGQVVMGICQEKDGMLFMLPNK